MAFNLFPGDGCAVTCEFKVEGLAAFRKDESVTVKDAPGLGAPGLQVPRIFEATRS